MPIIGLTDGQPSFKELGRLRKGAPKSEGLKDLEYIRADFRPDEPEAFARWVAAYPKEPTRINVRIAFPDLAASWDANWEVYNTAGQLGRSDGKRWVYLRDHQTGALLVKDGVPQDDAGLPVDESGMPYMPFDPAKVVYSYWSKKKQRDMPVYPKLTGKLKLLIPELKMVAFMVAITHSVYDVYQINSQLLGIVQIAKNMNMPLPMLPLVFFRRMQTISTTYGGKKHLEEKSLLNIEIRQDWAEAQFDVLERIMPGMALPTPAPVLELPADLAEAAAHDEDDEQEEELPDCGPQQMAMPMGGEPAPKPPPTSPAYADGTLVDPTNAAETEAFSTFAAAMERKPASRAELRDWTRAHRNGDKK